MQREYIVVEKMGNSITSAGPVITDRGEREYRTVTLATRQDQVGKASLDIGDELNKNVKGI